eukprot:GHVU01154891.1.p3 GENE.GHVU01154891.1~~GHVU01154891.1.p3  ORF type:complete len:113 (+),score=3.45 GHVU01154891.1:660-998(+)
MFTGVEKLLRHCEKLAIEFVSIVEQKGTLLVGNVVAISHMILCISCEQDILSVRAKEMISQHTARARFASSTRPMPTCPNSLRRGTDLRCASISPTLYMRIVANPNKLSELK